MLNNCLVAQSPTLEWAKRIGGLGPDYVHDITVDENGNIYSTGQFNNTVDFDPGPNVYNLFKAHGMFVSKLDSAGHFVWAKEFGGEAVVQSAAVEVDSYGNTYITGYYHGTADFDPGIDILSSTSDGLDIFILKLDDLGNLLWAKFIEGSGYEMATSIVVDELSKIYLTGYFNGSLDFNPGPGVYNVTSNSSDAYILKLDSTGGFIWMKQINDAYGRSISIDIRNNIYISGEFTGIIDFDPGFGIHRLDSENGSTFMLKFDSVGNFIMAKNIHGFSSEIKTDNEENIYVCGSFRNSGDFDPGAGSTILTSKGSVDVFFSKYDSASNLLWAKSIGGKEEVSVYSSDIDQYGNYYLTGAFYDTTDFDPSDKSYNLIAAEYMDVFIAKFNHKGNLVWALRIGDEEHQRGTSIAIDNIGSIITAGWFSSKVDFDPSMDTFFLNANSSPDFFIHKMSQEKIDLELSTIITPVEIRDSCFSSNEQFEVSITNVGFIPVDFTRDTTVITIDVNYDGQTITYQKILYTNLYNDGFPIEVGDSFNVPIGSLDLNNNLGFYRFAGSITSKNDHIAINDSILVKDVSYVYKLGNISGPYKICGNGVVNFIADFTGKIQWQRMINGTFVDEPNQTNKLMEAYIDQTTSFRAVVCGQLISDTVTVVKEPSPPMPQVVHDTVKKFCGESDIVSLYATCTLSGAEILWYADTLSSNYIFSGNNYKYKMGSTTPFHRIDTFYVTAKHPHNDCESERVLVTATTSCMEKVQTIVVRPNVTKGSFNIIGENIEVPVEVNVYNPNGKIIYKLDKNLIGNFTQEINLSQFAKGMYFVKLQRGKAIDVEKVILQ